MNPRVNRKVEVCRRAKGLRIRAIWGFAQTWVPFLGVPLRGFFSIWGIKGVPLFW